MKKFYFFLVILFSFFTFSNFVFGQEMKEEIKTIFYNSEIGDWDIVFPVSENAVRGIKPEIRVNTVWPLKAEFTERGIELVQPSELVLESGQEYFFEAFYYEIIEEKISLERDTFSIKAPEITVEMNYQIENEKIEIQGSFLNEVDLYFSQNKSHLVLGNNNVDSIIYGKDKIIKISYISQNDFSASEEIIKDQMEKYLSCVIIFENQFGEEKLRFFQSKDLLFKKEDKGFVVKNLFGVGSITPYWNDGELRNGYVFDMNGNCVKQLSVLSGEQLWFDIPSGMYVFKIEGIGQQKIIKY